MAEVADLMRLAAMKRLAGVSAEQREARRLVDERNAKLQGAPIVRGANAPKCGTFGGAAS